MARPVIAKLRGNLSKSELLRRLALQSASQMSTKVPPTLSALTGPKKLKLEPYIKAAVDDIFKGRNIKLNTEQLEKVALSVSEILSDIQDSSKAAETGQVLKPISEEELRLIIGERIATMTVGGGSEEKKTMLVLGMGNMARAISEGLNADVEAIVQDESKPRDDKAGASISYLSKTNPAYKRIFEKTYSSVILSVKPQKLGEIAEDLKKLQLESSTTIFSVLAGISTDILKSVFPENAVIIRTMPNTPMAVGYGVTGVYLPPKLWHEKAKTLEYFGSNRNQVVFVDREEQINAVTGLSGSGPAYFFLLAEKIAQINQNVSEKDVLKMMQDACAKVDIAKYEQKKAHQGSLEEMIKESCADNGGIEDFILSFTKGLYEKALKLGFSPEDAKTLAVGTPIGAGKYGLESELSAKTLRENVTSPGGTTFEALKVFNETTDAQSLDQLTDNAVQAAVDKAVVLGNAAEEKFLGKALASSSAKASETLALMDSSKVKFTSK